MHTQITKGAQFMGKQSAQDIIPWIRLRPTSMQKSPRTVPGSDCSGLVAPTILRPVTTDCLPSHTIATTGPLHTRTKVRQHRLHCWTALLALVVTLFLALQVLGTQSSQRVLAEINFWAVQPQHSAPDDVLN